MKLKLVSENGTKLLYCPNGSILKADEEVLIRLLTKFNTPTKFKGEDGCWNSLNSDMTKAPGKTLAIVDDQLNLIVYSPKAFEEIDVPSDYISPSEYAELHGKSHSLIKRLCEEDRIVGAKKIRSCWLIPANAPYPERKKREVKKKEEPKEENK